VSLLPIITIPDPILKSTAAPVNEITPEVSLLAADMTETMRHFRHCVGLAAPQVNKSLRLIAVDVSLYHKPHPNHGLLVLINPVIRHAEGKLSGREGCLSVPDLTGNVTRAKKVLVEGITLKHAPIRLEAEGFEAVVLQHEIDHLNGLLFLDRVSSLKTDVFRRKSY